MIETGTETREHPTQWDKYLNITMAARTKYAEPDGRLVVSVGETPTRYSLVEMFAWNYFIVRNRCPRSR